MIWSTSRKWTAYPRNWSAVELRPATQADFEFVYAATRAAMRGYVEATFGPWEESFQRNLIAQSFDVTTHKIISIDGVSAGLLASQGFDTHVQLEKLYLLPQFQRKGIGSTVLRELIATARASSKPIKLRVLTVNIDARRLYERHGFVVSNVTPERIHMEYHPR